MKNDSWMKTLCVCGTVVACAVVMSQAGPLDPPGGPVASSYNTLDQVEARFPIDDAGAPGNATSSRRADRTT